MSDTKKIVWVVTKVFDGEPDTVGVLGHEPTHEDMTRLCQVDREEDEVLPVVDKRPWRNSEDLYAAYEVDDPIGDVSASWARWEVDGE